MKCSTLIFLLASLVQLHAEVSHRVLEKGPYHRRVRVKYDSVDERGTSVAKESEYVELANGAHRKAADGAWTESETRIDARGDTAVATGGPIEVTFLANPNSDGAVTLVAPDGKVFRSHVLGLAYTDGGTGQSVLFAPVQDAQGEIVPPNQVVYRNAYQNIQADLVYTYTAGSFEQDVVLLSEPPAPEVFALLSDLCVLEIFTEFLSPPLPRKEQYVLRTVQDPQTREASAMPDVIDQRLDFGAMSMGVGHAFFSSALPFEGESTRVGKSWENREGRTFLVERLVYEAVKKDLSRLPQEANVAPSKTKNLANLTRGRGLVPKATRKPATTGARPMLVADAGAVRKGYVIDYAMVATAANVTLRSGNTYVVNPSGVSTVVLSGVTTIEPGVVIKLAPGKALEISGSLVCKARAFHPIICTSTKDSTVGDYYAPGVPTAADNALAAIRLTGSGQSYALNDVHVRWATDGVRLVNGSLTLQHCMFHQCSTGVTKDSTAGALQMRNVLMDQVGTVVSGASAAANTGQHLTLHDVTGGIIGGTVPALALQNSILANVANAVLGTSYTYASGSSATDVIQLASDSGVFKRVSDGRNYLSDSSPYRNRGLSVGSDQASIDFDKELRRRTTFAPLELKNVPASGKLNAVNECDGGALDPGFHYVKLDWVTGGLDLPSGNVTSLLLTNGVSIGCSGLNGFRLGSGSDFTSGGLPHRLNRMVFTSAVQERCDGGFTTREGLIKQTASYIPIVMRFTDFGCLARSESPIYNASSSYYLTRSCLPLSITDCQWMGGTFTMRPDGYLMVFGVTNSLFEGVSMTFDQRYYEAGYYTGSQAFFLSMRNVLFNRGDLTLYYRDTSQPWIINDSFFDAASLSATVYPGTSIGNTNNAYSGTTALPGAINSRTVNSPAYVTGDLGRYYYSTTSGAGTLFTELIDTGSRTASAATLSQHTVLAANTKDSGTVDRGFHYPALTAGVPTDADSDSRWDLWEDANESGSVDAGETNWQVYNSPNGLTANTDFRVYTPLR